MNHKKERILAIAAQQKDKDKLYLVFLTIVYPLLVIAFIGGILSVLTNCQAKPAKAEKSKSGVHEIVLKSISILPDLSSIPAGMVSSFSANGIYSDDSVLDISDQVQWFSGNEAVSVVDANGVASGLIPGHATISASLDGVVSNAVDLTVTTPILASISVSPLSANLQMGLSLQFTASGIMTDGSVAILDNLSWASGDSSIAMVDVSGLVTGVNTGTTYVAASMSGVTSNMAAITILLPQTAPVANAGGGKNASTGSLVTLDGSASYDVNGDPLVYTWSAVSVPAGSLAALSSSGIVHPTFIADVTGTYIWSLVVNDGFVDSLPSTVAIAVYPACGSPLVISQIYGGGGNSGATYNQDFIELHNRSVDSADTGAWSLQYASAAGTSWTLVNLSGVIAPGGYYLIGLAGGANGVALPAPDFTGTVNMAASSGKVALVNSQAAITSCGQSGVLDLAGYGTANCWEGTAAAGSPSATASLTRNNAACDDTNNNVSDFTVGAPQPRNSLSPVYFCGCL
ncbi:MAG: Ig-like domain-containing protein [Spirochaetia bacterium]|nr:Ig-like domain-containing protein [Spirochaetia bacterium]